MFERTLEVPWHVVPSLQRFDSIDRIAMKRDNAQGQTLVLHTGGTTRGLCRVNVLELRVTRPPLVEQRLRKVVWPNPNGELLLLVVLVRQELCQQALVPVCGVAVDV